MPPNRTCVANATDITIHARVRKEELAKKISVEVNYKSGNYVKITNKIKQEMANEGFSPVHSRNWIGFYPGGSTRDGTVYVSVYTSKGECLVLDHPVPDNFSVIFVQNTEGKYELKISEQGDVWADESGLIYNTWDKERVKFYQTPMKYIKSKVNPFPYRTVCF